MSGIREKTYRTYFRGVVALGTAVLAFSCYQAATGGAGYRWLFLASLAVLTGSFTVRIPGIGSKISVAETFIFTNTILFGPAVGALTAALDGFVASIRTKTPARRWEFAAFNTSTMALSAYLAGWVFSSLVALTGFGEASTIVLPQVLLPLLLMAVTYYVTNVALVSAILALDLCKQIYIVWRENFLWLAATYVTAALIAGLLAVHMKALTFPVIWATLMALPAAYFTCKLHLEKVGVTDGR